ncbi:hypothetical protein FOZ63_005706, partial [Perkinsus olseni]
QQVDDSNTHISPEIPDAPAEAHPEKGEGPGDNEVLRSSAGEAAYAAAFAVKVEGAHEDVRRHPIEAKQQTSTQPPSFKLPKGRKGRVASSLRKRARPSSEPDRRTQAKIRRKAMERSRSSGSQASTALRETRGYRAMRSRHYNMPQRHFWKVFLKTATCALSMPSE